MLLSEIDGSLGEVLEHASVKEEKVWDEDVIDVHH
jgi:hypothetical protein